MRKNLARDFGYKRMLGIEVYASLGSKKFPTRDFKHLKEVYLYPICL